MPNPPTVHLLASAECVSKCGADFDILASHHKIRFHYVHPGAPADELRKAEAAVFLYGEMASPLLRTVGEANAVPNLKFLSSGWAGTDDPFFEKLRRRGIHVVGSPGVSAEPIAHSVVGAMLSLNRGFHLWGKAQRERKWRPYNLAVPVPFRPRDMRGQRAVVLGYGGIGRSVATLLQAIGMHVTGIRRSADAAGEPVDAMVQPGELERVVATADWLINCAPLTNETAGIVSRSVIRCMPPGSHYVNVGRGGTTDEEALVDALLRGHIAGAYLDVFAVEPLPAASKLWDLENVIISPHNSSGSDGNQERSRIVLRENLSAWLGENAKAAAGAKL